MAVSTSAIARRTRDGTLSSPMPGKSMTMAATRAKVIRNVVDSAGRYQMSIRILCFRLAADYGFRDPQHFSEQFLGHERQGDEQRNKDRQYFRHEGESHFLDLRQGLKQ